MLVRPRREPGDGSEGGALLCATVADICGMVVILRMRWKLRMRTAWGVMRWATTPYVAESAVLGPGLGGSFSAFLFPQRKHYPNMFMGPRGQQAGRNRLIMGFRVK